MCRRSMFSKDVDKASPILIQKMQDNEAFDTCDIIVRKTQPGGHFNYYVINLINARIVNLTDLRYRAGMEKISEIRPASCFPSIRLRISRKRPKAGQKAARSMANYNMLTHVS